MCRAGPIPSTCPTRQRGMQAKLWGVALGSTSGGRRIRIQLGNINRGLRDPRINPELEADTRGQRRGSALAVFWSG